MASSSYYVFPPSHYARSPHDPPDETATKPLTKDEQMSILTGSGHPLRYGVPTAEDNPDMYPARARGYYPNAGHFERMGRRNPITAAGLTKTEYYVPSLDWRIELEEATEAEQARIDQVVEWLDDMPGGMSMVIRLLTTAVQYGFCLQEIEWFELPDGTMGPKSLLWVRPATIHDWVVDEVGREIGFRQIDDEGGVSGPLPLGKFVHFAWRYRPRSPEGISALRPLFSYDEYKGEELRDSRITRRRFNGTLVWTQPEGFDNDGPDSKRERNAVEKMSQMWCSGVQAYLIKPHGWEYEIEQGGSDGPDAVPLLQYLDHQHARQLDDTLGELGMSRYGSHAAGSEMRLATQKQLTGVCSEMATALEQQLLRRIWRVNGWAGRVPKVNVTGFEDDARINAIVQLANSGLIDVTDPHIRKQAARSVGLTLGAKSAPIKVEDKGKNIPDISGDEGAADG